MFFLGLSWCWKMQALSLDVSVLENASSFPRASICQSLGSGEPLAPSSDQNKVFGIFLSIFAHFFCFVTVLGGSNAG